MNYTDQLRQKVNDNVSKELKAENKNKLQEKIQELKEKITTNKEEAKQTDQPSA